MPDNTPSWKVAVDKALRDLIERHRRGMNDYRAGKIPTPLGMDIAKSALNSAVKELVLASRPELYDTKDVPLDQGFEHDVGWNAALTKYQANIIKAIEGES